VKPVKAMHKILKRMIGAAEHDDFDAFEGLNARYKALIPNVYESPLSERDRSFEMCRQSAMLALQFGRMGLDQEYAQNITEARKILPDLKKYIL
jgi:hypothetical protein